jgi:ribosome-associated protein
MIQLPQSYEIPREELHFQYSRSGGPGGQNVNKVSSKAQLKWNARETTRLPERVKERFLTQYASRLTNEGEVVIASQLTRDQRSNHEDCLTKLREMIMAVWTAPKKRRPTKPSKGSKERRLKSKQSTSQKKNLRRNVGGE